MPHASLEFNLPDEEDDFRHACHGEEYYEALRALDEHLRDRIKYEMLLPEVEEALAKVRTFIREFAPRAFVWD